MTDILVAADTAMRELMTLRKALKKNASRQVTSIEERALIKATAYTWFQQHRQVVTQQASDLDTSQCDNLYRSILEGADKATSRRVYLNAVASLKQALIELRSLGALSNSSASAVVDTTNQPPNFAPLISDPKMQVVLARRWVECLTCISAGAPLAATVMMGGLLEALILARIHHEKDQGPIFTARSAPKEKASGKTLPLKEWMLRNYIDVAHDLGWISLSAKDVGEVLRDYRNYIHPYKELSHSVELTVRDVEVLWEVSKGISRQILRSV